MINCREFKASLQLEPEYEPLLMTHAGLWAPNTAISKQFVRLFKDPQVKRRLIIQPPAA